MSTRSDRKLQHEKYEALKIYALNYDIEPRFDYGRAGASPPERAFHLLSCGFDMLVVLMASAFPSLDRRTAKTGSKWIREALMWNAAQGGRFLARVTPTLLAHMQGELGDGTQDDIEPVPDPDLHMSLRRSVEDFFPKFVARRGAFAGEVNQLVEACSAEFEVMKTGKPREAVAEREEQANEYSRALLRGEDPNQDTELVALQRLYARDYFIHQALLGAFLTSMFEADAKRLSPKTIPYLDPNDVRLSEFRARALDAWVRSSRPYREYAALEFRNAGPVEKQQWASTGTAR